MADDGKRTEQVCFKVSERMALDLLRLSTSQDLSVSAFMYAVLRTRLYGDMVRLEVAAEQHAKSDKVNRADE